MAGMKLCGIVSALALIASSAAARERWDCTYEDAEAARYVAHFDVRAEELVEAHWGKPVVYRILKDTREALVAVHAFAEPSAFRRDTEAGADVLIIDKRTGRMKRSTVVPGDALDETRTGQCTVG